MPPERDATFTTLAHRVLSIRFHIGHPTLESRGNTQIPCRVGSSLPWKMVENHRCLSTFNVATTCALQGHQCPIPTKINEGLAAKPRSFQTLTSLEVSKSSG